MLHALQSASSLERNIVAASTIQRCSLGYTAMQLLLDSDATNLRFRNYDAYRPPQKSNACTYECTIAL